MSVILYAAHHWLTKQVLQELHNAFIQHTGAPYSTVAWHMPDRDL